MAQWATSWNNETDASRQRERIAAYQAIAWIQSHSEHRLAAVKLWKAYALDFVLVDVRGGVLGGDKSRAPTYAVIYPMASAGEHQAASELRGRKVVGFLEIKGSGKDPAELMSADGEFRTSALKYRAIKATARDLDVPVFLVVVFYNAGEIYLSELGSRAAPDLVYHGRTDRGPDSESPQANGLEPHVAIPGFWFDQIYKRPDGPEGSTSDARDLDEQQ